MPEFGLFAVPLPLLIGIKFYLSMASRHANGQNFLERSLAARAVLIAAKMVPNRRLTMELCCELLGAVDDTFVPFDFNYLSNGFALFSFALSEWYILIELPTAT